MRYSQIRNLDVSNGEGLGIALFVQGCHFMCKNCFNSTTWDFNGGEEWNDDTMESFLELANKPYIKRISILGGESLADENIEDVLKLVKAIRATYGNTKNIWLYTGYTWEEIINTEKSEILNYIDVLVDGRFVDSLKDLTLKFRGSSNQRLIDVQKSLVANEIILLQ